MLKNLNFHSNNIEEIWKDIPGYEGLYQVSNLGRVKSLHYRNKYSKKEQILKSRNNGDGYLSVILKNKKKYIHRLVAETFISNSNNFSEINHKDENKANNCIDNLEWCTRKYNCNYGTKNERVGKKVIQYDKKMNKIKEYKTISEASRETNIFNSSISAVCKGKRKTAGGYIWRFINE